jgi:regulator of sigma E protease
VKIRGEDFDEYDPKDPHNFMNKKPWQRSIILLAGIFMNFIFAVLVFYFLLASNGWKSSPLVVLADYNFPFGEKVEVTNIVVGLASGSNAEKAGMEFGDRITKLSVGDLSIEPKSPEELISFVSDKEGQEIEVLTENINTDVKSTYKITPTFNEEVQRAALGVQLGEVIQLAYETPLQRVFSGFTHSVNIMGYSFKIMGSLISTSIDTGDVGPVAQGVSGPVGIFGAVQSITELGRGKVLMAILDLTALLSLSLAIMNLLPFPALDGGRWVFVLSEWVTGRKPSAKLEARAHQIGFMILIVFIVLVTFKDIFQLFG